MAGVRDTSAHVIAEMVRREVRNAFKGQTALRATEGTSIVQVATTNAGATITGGGSSTSSGGIASVAGTDYSVWPLSPFTYDTFDARFSNLETFVAALFVTSMRGDGDGHHHSGVAGDGPLLPATSVLLPGGSVGSGTTLDDHLKDAGLHSGVTRVALFDDFQTTDQNARWEILAGSPARTVDIATGNTRWHLPAGSRLRIKNDPGFSFNERLTVRFDLTFASAPVTRKFEVRCRYRPGSTGFSYVAGLSSSELCYISELDHSIMAASVEATGAPLPNDSVMRQVEVGLDRAQVRLDYNGEHVSYAIPRDDADQQGYLEFNAISEVYLDNVLVARHQGTATTAHHAQHHATGSDPLDVKDLADSMGLLAPGGVPGAHHATHHAGGLDPLDVKDLADSTGTRLTAGQRTALTTGANADGYHTHAGLLTRADTVAKSTTRANAAGSGSEVSRADHVHATPHWDLEFYLVNDFSAGQIVTAADFDSAPRATVRKGFHPTVAGEFHFNGYGHDLYLRAKLKVKNSGADRVVSFLIPSLSGTMKVTLTNSGGETVLTTQTAASVRLNAAFTGTMKAGEVNTLTIYGGANVDWHQFWLAIADSDGDLFAASKSLAYEP